MSGGSESGEKDCGAVDGGGESWPGPRRGTLIPKSGSAEAREKCRARYCRAFLASNETGPRRGPLRLRLFSPSLETAPHTRTASTATTPPRRAAWPILRRPAHPGAKN
jgi:hypothetical protein